MPVSSSPKISLSNKLQRKRNVPARYKQDRDEERKKPPYSNILSFLTSWLYFCHPYNLSSLSCVRLNTELEILSKFHSKNDKQRHRIVKQQQQRHWLATPGFIEVFDLDFHLKQETKLNSNSSNWFLPKMVTNQTIWSINLAKFCHSWQFNLNKQNEFAGIQFALVKFWIAACYFHINRAAC